LTSWRWEVDSKEKDEQKALIGSERWRAAVAVSADQRWEAVVEDVASSEEGSGCTY
jgi:hypothetical protein